MSLPWPSSSSSSWWNTEQKSTSYSHTADEQRHCHNNTYRHKIKSRPAASKQTWNGWHVIMFLLCFMVITLGAISDWHLIEQVVNLHNNTNTSPMALSLTLNERSTTTTQSKIKSGSDEKRGTVVRNLRAPYSDTDNIISDNISDNISIKYYSVPSWLIELLSQRWLLQGMFLLSVVLFVLFNKSRSTRQSHYFSWIIIILPGLLLILIVATSEQKRQTSPNTPACPFFRGQFEPKSLWNIYQESASRSSQDTTTSAAATAETSAVTLIFTSDVHGHIKRECRPLCYPGASHLSHVVQTVRTAAAHTGENVLLVDAGDATFGSRFNETAVASTMNRLNYQAMVLGNHELDNGLDRLEAFARDLQAPILVSNVRGLSFVQDHVVFQLGDTSSGVSLCLFGVTAQEANPLAGANVEISDAVSSAVSTATKLRNQCDLLVAVSHVGIDTDQTILNALADADISIDGMIGGHSHTIMGANGNTMHPESPDFGVVLDQPFPCWDGSGGTFRPTVAHAGANGRYAGLLRVEWFTHTKNLASVRGELLPLDANHGVENDEEFEQWQSEMIGSENEKNLSKEGYEDIDVAVNGHGSSGDTVCGQSCRTGECLLGNLISSAMHHCLDHGTCSAHRSEHEEPLATFALLESGTLRSCVSAGTGVSFQEVLPWDNNLVLLAVNGSTVFKMLEHGVTSFTGSNGGAFLQVAGLNYRHYNGKVREVWLSRDKIPKNRALNQTKGSVRFDLGKPSLEDFCSVATSASRTPLNESAKYLIVVTDWLASGGDGFGDIIDSADVVATNISLHECISEFFKSSPTIQFERRSNHGSKSWFAHARILLSGFLGGAASFLLTYPVSTMFVRTAMSKPILWGCSRLFDGVVPGTIATAVQDSIFFGVYEQLFGFSPFARSTIASVANIFVTSPFWVIMTQKQLMGKSLSSFHVAKHIYQERGVAGFFDGISMSLLMCSFPVVRQVALDAILQTQPLTNPAIVAVSAALASIVATIVTYPIQKMRVHLQSGDQFTAPKSIQEACCGGILLKVLDSCLKTLVLFLVKEHSAVSMCQLEG